MTARPGAQRAHAARRPRLPAVEEAGDSARLERIFGRFAERGAEVPQLYQLLANAPAMLEAWIGLAWPLRAAATTPRALRELLILRIAQLTGASYEWQAHEPFAREFGVREAQIAELAEWTASDQFDETERSALAAADELTASGELSDDAFGSLAQRFDPGELVELILTISFYCCVSRVLKAIGLEATGSE